MMCSRLFAASSSRLQPVRGLHDGDANRARIIADLYAIAATVTIPAWKRI